MAAAVRFSTRINLDQLSGRPSQSVRLCACEMHQQHDRSFQRGNNAHQSTQDGQQQLVRHHSFVSRCIRRLERVILIFQYPTRNPPFVGAISIDETRHTAHVRQSADRHHSFWPLRPLCNQADRPELQQVYRRSAFAQLLPVQRRVLYRGAEPGKLPIRLCTQPVPMSFAT